MVADGDPRVRYQLAFSLGALPQLKPTVPLAELAIRDGADPWVRLALLSSAGRCAGALFERLASLPSFRATPAGRTFLTALATETDVAHRPDDLARVLHTVEGMLPGDSRLARDVVLGLLGRMSASGSARPRLPINGEGRVASLVASVLAEARNTAGDASRPVADRAAAIRRLRIAGFDEIEAPLAATLGSRQPPQVQTAAIETLAQFDDPRVPALLLRAWGGLSPALRATAAEALFTRPAWLGLFLDAVESGRVGRGDVDPARLELLKTYPVATVRDRAARLFAQGVSRRAEVVAAYQPALSRQGDRDRGKVLFKTHCSSCHRLEGVGQQVGADLAAIRDRGLDSVLLNILDPNREVKPQYQSYLLVTDSGRILTGMIAAETANSVTLKKPDGGEETVLRFQIDELKSTGLSFMPEGLEKQLDVAAMADLLAYLSAAPRP
jgi:putative heme-binding domain-containing protein